MDKTIRQLEENNRERILELEKRWAARQEREEQLLNDKVDYKDVQQAFANIKNDYDQKIQRQEEALLQSMQENQH